MAISRENLWQFMAEHVPHWELFPRTKQVMEPFFRYAETGRCNFGPADQERLELKTKAIALATGLPASTVTPVSLKVLQQSPLPDDIRRLTVGDRFWPSDSPLCQSLWSDRRRPFYDDHREALVNVLSRNLGEDLKRALTDTVRRAELLPVCWQNLAACLLYYFSFLVAGRGEDALRLEPLILSETWGITLGRSETRPGEWLACFA